MTTRSGKPTAKKTAKGTTATARKRVAKSPKPLGRTTRKTAATTRDEGERGARQPRLVGARSAAPRRPSTEGATEGDLADLVVATRTVFQRLHAIDPDTLPSDEARQEYFSNRHIARKAFETAELAAFEELVDEQKAQLPAVKASNVKLAKDVATTAAAIGVVNLVSASIGVLESVISLLA